MGRHISLLLASLRCCPHCGRLFSLNPLLCPDCSRLLLSACQPHWHPEPPGFPLHCLFHWRPGRSDSPVSLMAQLLKGRHWELAVDDLFAQLWPLWQRQLAVLPRASRLVPVGTSPGCALWQLAECLARHTGWSLVESPQRITSPQKGKSRAHRQAVQFVAAPVAGPVVLIDDTVTTGASLRAAWRALGQPRPAWGICLFNRLRSVPERAIHC